MRSLDGLHVQVVDTILRPDRGVPGICQGTRLPVAEARHVVFVPAEVLGFVGPIPLVSKFRESCKGSLLQFERTKLVGYHIPDDLIRRHDESRSLGVLCVCAVVAM